MSPMERLQYMALTISAPIAIVHPTRHRVELLSINFSRLTDKTYNVNGGIAAFVENSKLFVTPFIEGIEEFLEDEGFTHSENLCVPFSDGFSYPHEEWRRRLWQDLKRLAKG